MNAKEENPNFAAKKLFINPISDTDQREIADRKILKILVRCFLPTSRLMMAGTAEYKTHSARTPYEAKFNMC